MFINKGIKFGKILHCSASLNRYEHCIVISQGSLLQAIFAKEGNPRDKSSLTGRLFDLFNRLSSRWAGRDQDIDAQLRCRQKCLSANQDLRRFRSAYRAPRHFSRSYIRNKRRCLKPSNSSFSVTVVMLFIINIGLSLLKVWSTSLLPSRLRWGVSLIFSYKPLIVSKQAWKCASDSAQKQQMLEKRFQLLCKKANGIINERHIFQSEGESRIL